MACCPPTGCKCIYRATILCYLIYRVVCSSQDLVMLFHLFAIARTCVFAIFHFALYIFIEKRTVLSGDLLSRATRLQAPANQLG